MNSGTVFWRKLCFVCLLILIGVGSFTKAAPKFSSLEHPMNRFVIETIDGQIEDVLQLTGASTAASVAVSALPDDTATPIAEKLSDFSSYFVAVLCILYLQKFLAAFFLWLLFAVMVPLASVCGIGYVIRQTDGMKRSAFRVLLLGIVLAFMMPASAFSSRKIYSLYQGSLDSKITAAESLTIEISKSGDAEEAQEAGGEREDNPVEKADKPGMFSWVINKATDLTSGAIRKAKELITGFMEALAIMIVTACLIPLLIMLSMLWIAAQIFKVDLKYLLQGGAASLKKRKEIS